MHHSREDRALAALAAECPLRLGAELHRCGRFAHFAAPGDGRVHCFGRSCDPPESWRPSAAQDALYDAQEGRQ